MNRRQELRIVRALRAAAKHKTEWVYIPDWQRNLLAEIAAAIMDHDARAWSKKKP